MLNFMLQVPNFERFDRGALRWMMSGAAPVPVSLIERYAELSIDILQVYGLTETCGPALLNRLGERPHSRRFHRRGFFTAT